MLHWPLCTGEVMDRHPLYTGQIFFKLLPPGWQDRWHAHRELQTVQIIVSHLINASKDLHSVQQDHWKKNPDARSYWLMHNGSIDTWLTSSVTVMAACQTYCFPGKIFFVLSFWNWYKFSMTTNFSQIKVHPYSLEVHGYI